MRSATVNIKQIPAMEFRFDPSLHLSEGVKVRETLAELPYEVKPLSSVTERIFLGNIFSRIWVKDKQHGVPYLAASDTVLANLDTGQFLAKRQAVEMPYLVLEKGWILVTCSGTLGNTSYTNGNYAGRIATHDLIRIVPNEDELPGGYVYAFLSSKYGYYQITQSQFGGVVKHINATQAGQIQIPVLPKETVSESDRMIKESTLLREKASDALKAAHARFAEEISIKVKPISHSINIREITSLKGKRFEGAIYTEKAKAFLDTIAEAFDYKTVQELTANIFTQNIFKREYVENGHPFLMGADILKSIPTASKYISYRQASKKDELFVKEGWILMTCSGSVGDVVFVDKQLEPFIYTHDLIRIVPKDYKTQLYLFGFLSSPIGKELVNHFKYGSVIQHLESFHVADIPVPMLGEYFDEIVENVREYTESVYKAKMLELEAISMVEAEIEKWSK